ncbi:response regulator transcription factor [Niveispirillum sp. KHB5.9]|uniref:response regulator transcription factor n=1 Tax=Niveispirillum sp. KHB5.9 TaxID=3400269 RepID=UPI003A8C202C
MADVDFTKLKVLIVDDDQFYRGILKRLLLQVGVRMIAEAENGETALTSITRLKPDAVLCDIEMEPVNGIEVLRRVRTSDTPQVADTPIVMVTSHATSDLVKQAVENQASGYLVKPVSLTDIQKRLTVAVQTRRAV